MSVAFELTEEKKRLLETRGNLLVLGGPGSGKTTIALLKAKHEIHKGTLASGQKILFLSFSRATIARVIEQVGKLISKADRSILEINTYHGFTWNILRSHGYLLKGNQRIRLLPPPEASSKLAEVSRDKRMIEKSRLFDEEGLLHFDLFATMCVRLLSKSNALAKIICDAYPIVILDEFQDTDSEQWEMVKILGKKSRIISLADPEQRIYEFRGADPRRISDFIKEHTPTSFDFGLENNRSNGTDIVLFGNDLLKGVNKGKTYKDVEIIVYQVRAGSGACLTLKTEILKGIERLKKSGKIDWSIAILVPAKQLMLDVSYYLSVEQHFTSGGRLPVVQHDIALESHGPALASILMARILEGATTDEQILQQFIEDLRLYLLGRKGEEPTQKDLTLALKIRDYLGSKSLRRGTNLEKIVNEGTRIANQRQQMQLTGSPREDWVEIGRSLIVSPIEIIRQVVQDSTYLQLLRKGSILNSKLSEAWRATRSYAGAASIIQDALLQEYFSSSIKQWRGINVMTIHKAKGKEFDEVFVYEGNYSGRIVVGSSDNDIAQAKLKLRVAVTRAMRRTTILTPSTKVCPLL